MAWNVDCVCDRSRQQNVAQRRECDYTRERRVTISLRSPLLLSSSPILPSHCGSRGNIRDYYSLTFTADGLRWCSLTVFAEDDILRVAVQLIFWFSKMCRHFQKALITSVSSTKLFVEMSSISSGGVWKLQKLRNYECFANTKIISCFLQRLLFYV